MTQADVADRVGLASEVYGRLERGTMTPSVGTLRRLCVVLGISSDVALGLEDSRQPTATLDPVTPENTRLRRLTRRALRLTPSSVRVLSLVAAHLPTRRRAPKSQP
jgi:transcriptional regulator with XRE-family HTH domain